MRAFQNSSSITGKICVLLFSVLIVSTTIVGCVDEKARSEKNKGALMLMVSDFGALQDKALAMMERGEADAAKKFAETTVAEKRTELSNSIEEKVKEQLITPADQAIVLKAITDKENEFTKKAAAFQKK